MSATRRGRTAWARPGPAIYDGAVTSKDGVTAQQATIGGAGYRLGHRVAGTVCLLTAVGVAVSFLTGQVDWPWWVSVPVGIIAVVVLVVVGLAIWFSADVAVAETERLRRAGRPATAQILALRMEDPQDGNADYAVLTLRISGDGVPEFEADYRCDIQPEMQVGARLKAVVDPADNLFTLRTLP